MEEGMTAPYYIAAIGIAVLVALVGAISMDRATSVPSAPQHKATLDFITDAQRKGEIALAKGDRAQACVQGQLQVTGWLDLAGSLPKGTAEQETAEKTYATLTKAVRAYCGF
jgi:hypothetical protein